MLSKRAILLLTIALALLLGAFLLAQPEALSPQRLRDIYQQQPLASAAGYFALYLLVAALALPGAAIMTMAGGAIFGFWTGLLLVSFASSIGATLAFLLARTVARDWVAKRFAGPLAKINAGIEREGAFYLFSLRLIPLIPFFAINLAFGLTRMPTRTFYWVSQLGMLAGTAVFVNAGHQIGNIEQLNAAGILTWQLWGAFALLAIFPYLARWLLRLLELPLTGWWRGRRAYRGWSKPAAFDYNLLVIGAGSAGLVSAYIAAALKAKVGLVERYAMGGDCLNTGCVPSKALLAAAKAAQHAREADRFGVRTGTVEVDFNAVMTHVRQAIRQIEPHDSVERFEGLGVRCLQGDATLTSPWTVSVDGREISARAIILATGGRPHVPDIPGLDTVDFLTSDSVWSLSALPRRLLVVGGGPIGCELAQAFARLGSEVTLAVRGERLLPREDTRASALLEAQMEAEGVRILRGQQPTRASANAMQFDCGGSANTVEFDRLLLATGREAATDKLGLEALGITTDARGFVQVDAALRTRFPNILAAGDVAGPYLFTHMAAHQAYYACTNALFGPLRATPVDYSAVPWATFTEPEVARVGLSEADANAQGIAFEVTAYDLEDHDRAIADGCASGFVKVLTRAGSDRILGATIVGNGASEIIGTLVFAMTHGMGLKKIMATTHIYPTYAEASKFAAGEWMKARKPERALGLLQKYFRRVRGSTRQEG
ncbi:FAD-dependent oxidoreductase [Biformimicrobium ophioploci]|uniref:Bifunctional TVP38/TMEM64 family protein/FAD-dependent oxidoreductase n=1 Tax=Biformimicrobium ophioploci TaxID=3036711 RepID=A0ABQ6LV12_9GAMM|nr:bifunctional TVP38/TMEM64 family protein/FAD-dependent oxidoreductase [Microbulbifer sp. NKW57]GMG85925.1 bifunctional TVP38/TMEM64 family protein/FAD-dependent oxidoreductase [Microbulbifer sp. NKW57]